MAYLEHKFIRPSTLKPRLYQEAIAANAKDHNLLCVLSTGLGKTIVGVLTAAHRLARLPNTKILCLAPTKPLATQLRNEFAKFLNFDESLFQVLTGAIAPKARKQIWDTAKFIFATPQTASNDLLRGILKLGDFSLVIFDECVAGDTDVLLANGSTMKIKDVVADFNKGKEVYVRSFDEKENKFVNKKVTHAQALPCLKRLFKIKIGSEHIKATEDHLFLIKNSFKTLWKSAKDLTLGSQIAVFPEDIYLKIRDNKSLLDKEGIIGTYSTEQQKNVEVYYNAIGLNKKFKLGQRRIAKKLNCSERQVENWIYRNITPKPLKTVKALKQCGLLPFSYSSPNIQIIARIVGHIFGDGWFYVPDKSKAVIGFSGKVENLKEIQADLDLLGLKYSSIYSRKTKSKVKGREIRGITSTFTCADRRLTRFLLALGLPSGNATLRKTSVPDWIMSGPLYVKREFLASLFGSDAHTPKGRSGSQSFYCIRFSLNKKKEFEANVLEYLQQIKQLLSEFKVNVSNIKIIPGNIWKDGTETIKGLLTISNSTNDLINFFSNISYRYCPEKEKIAVQCLNYLLKKSRVNAIRNKAYEYAIKLRGEGYDNRLIAAKLNLPTYQIEHWVYHKNKPGMTPISFPAFDSWRKGVANVPLKWEKISELSMVKSELVYDLTVEDTHNFIANGLIVHNCHRAIGDYNYVWLAEQAKKSECRILGLTASPGSEAARISQICSNLYIEKVEARDREHAEVQPYIQPLFLEYVLVEPSDELKNMRARLKKTITAKKADLRKFVRGRFTKKELLKLLDKFASRAKANPKYFRAISVCSALIKLDHALTLLESETLSALLAYFDGLHHDKSRAAKTLLSDFNVQFVHSLAKDMKSKGKENSKLAIVRKLIAKQMARNPRSKILLFTEFRDNVAEIISCLSGTCSADRFIGQSSRKERGMSQRQQLAAIEKLKAEQVNCLVCTSIAEEGLDIPNVDLVLFYSPIPSAIRFIQRKGRTGRTSIGRVIILAARGSRDEAYYWLSKRKEKKMYSVIKNMQEQGVIQQFLE